MKTFSEYTPKKSVINESTQNKYTLFPKDNTELKQMISLEIYEKQGYEADLNHIDVSEIEDFSRVFAWTSFCGDISRWDVSNARTMAGMFEGASAFNGDISNWDVSNVTDMNSMFCMTRSFNSDISEWDVSKVTNMRKMFMQAKVFNQDISG